MASRPTLKNKRLNKRDRDALLKFAGSKIEATEDCAALDAAYERAADAIYAVVLEKAPQKDMAVLKKYGMATSDACIFVSTGGYNYERFEYRRGDQRIALRPERDCRRQPILLYGDAEKAYDEYKAQEKARSAAIKSRYRDFAALIEGAPNFNALVEAWPAAEVMRESIVGTSTALAVLSSEVIDRIKADPALMAKAA